MEDRTGSAASTSLAVGQVLMWYRIEGVLGRGGFGITYLSSDLNLDRKVAIKEYLPTMFAQRHVDLTVKPLTSDHKDSFAWGLKSFLNEAQTLARFKHGNIVQVQTVFEHFGTAYMVMEYEHGDSLASLMQSGQTGIEQAYFENILFPVIDGLQFIHDAGFIHRDIKPANIFIRHDHSPVLIDFGSARETSVQSTGQMTALVSQGYTPLEQYSPNFGNQGPWTDIYAFAASIYHAVTGKMAEDSLSRCAAMQSGRTDPLKALAAATGDRFTPEFVYALEQGLLLNPQDRPQSLNEWKHMFEHGRPYRAPASMMSSTTSPSNETVVFSQAGRSAHSDRTSQTPDQDQEDSRTRVSPLQRNSTTGQAQIAVSVPVASQATGDETFVLPLGKTGLNNTASLPLTTESATAAQQSAHAGKAARTPLIAGGIFMLLAVAGGGWWYMQQTQATANLAVSSMANTLIRTLPKPESSMELGSPTERLRVELSSLENLSTLYAAALSLNPDSEEARDGMSYVADRYLRMAQLPLVQLDQNLRQMIIGALQSSELNEAKRVKIVSELESGLLLTDTEGVQLLLARQQRSPQERQQLMFSIASLPESDRASLMENPDVQAITATFKESIIQKLQGREFSTAANMIELALLTAPGDSELRLLKAHLEQ